MLAFVGLSQSRSEHAKFPLHTIPNNRGARRHRHIFVSREEAVDAEVSLEKMAQNCLLLENFWELNKERNDDMVYPTSGAAVCFGYLMAVRGLEGVVDGTYCSRSKDKPSQSCHQLHFCLPEHTSDTQILAVFLKYVGTHVADWREGASFHYLSAMQEAFPCKGERK
jgi:hypothetical protein